MSKVHFKWEDDRNWHATSSKVKREDGLEQLAYFILVLSKLTNKREFVYEVNRQRDVSP